MSEATRNVWRVAYAALVKWWPQDQWFPPAAKARQFFARRFCAETGSHICHRPQFNLLFQGSYGRLRPNRA